MRTSDEDVLARENYWKEVLLSREFGYNKTNVAWFVGVFT